MMSGEKKHPATERHRQKAKAEGRCAKSHDLTSALALVVAFAGLTFLGPSISGQLMIWLADSLRAVSATSLDSQQYEMIFSRGVKGFAKIVSPILVLMFLTIIAVSCAQTGVRFFTEKVRPTVGKVNPINGLQRIFSFAGMMRMVFGLMKAVIVLIIAWIAIRQDIVNLVTGLQSDLAASIGSLVGFLNKTCLKVSLVMLVLAVVDYLVQRWKHEKDLMMTDQELREEMRDAEGDRRMFTQRSRQKQMSQQALSRPLNSSLSEIVITGDANLAVSVVFDSKQRLMPKLQRKGLGQRADAISRHAKERGIVVAKQAVLANALHALVDEGQVIPLHLRRDLFPLLGLGLPV